jgi:hypothetical protein
MQNFSKRIPLYQMIACLGCSMVTGFIMWRMTIKSDAVITSWDQLIRLAYVLIAAGSYFGALWFASRYCNLYRREAIPALLFVSTLGTSLPFVVSTIHIWLTNQLEIAWFAKASAEAWVVVNLIMLALMAFLAGTGLVGTTIVKAVGKIVNQREAIHGQ